MEQGVPDNFKNNENTRHDHTGSGNAFDWIILVDKSQDIFKTAGNQPIGQLDLFFFFDLNDEGRRHLDLRK